MRWTVLPTLLLIIHLIGWINLYGKTQGFFSGSYEGIWLHILISGLVLGIYRIFQTFYDMLIKFYEREMNR